MALINKATYFRIRRTERQSIVNNIEKLSAELEKAKRPKAEIITSIKAIALMISKGQL